MDISSGEISFMVFRRVTRDDAGEFSLDGQMLSVLMELDGKKAVSEVAKNTGLSMGRIRQTISSLLKLKLIEPVEEAISTLDKDFFDYLKSQLALAIGPIAEVIIEDIVIDLGHSLSQFPSYRAAELVDLSSREIQREEKRNSFKQNMVKKIRDKGY
jgi:DNA-binding transcriptional ArsR family regulator